MDAGDKDAAIKATKELAEEMKLQVAQARSEKSGNLKSDNAKEMTSKISSNLQSI